MLKRFLLLLSIVLGVFAVAHADNGDGIPDVHIGDIWTYRSIDSYTNETIVEYSHTVVKVNEKEITLEIKNKKTSGKSLQYLTREWNCIDNVSARFDPFYPEYKFPLRAGTAWNKEYKATDNRGSWYSAFVKAKVDSMERVTVSAGTFDTYKIERTIEAHSTTANADSTTSKIITWYAPSINKFVRREVTTFSDGRERSKTVDELIDYSISGTKVDSAGFTEKNSASIAGLWVGSFYSKIRNQSTNVVALITETGVATILNRSNTGFSQCNGSLHGINNRLSGSLTAFLRAKKLGTLTLTGTLSTDRTMSGTYVGLGDSGTFSFVYNKLYERPSSLATIAGTYKAGPFTIIIDSNGNIVSSSSNSSCMTRGIVNVINSSFNIYEIKLNSSNCGSLTTANGLATLINAGETRTILDLGVASDEAAYIRGQYLRQ